MVSGPNCGCDLEAANAVESLHGTALFEKSPLKSSMNGPCFLADVNGRTPDIHPQQHPFAAT